MLVLLPFHNRFACLQAQCDTRNTCFQSWKSQMRRCHPQLLTARPPSTPFLCRLTASCLLRVEEMVLLLAHTVTARYMHIHRRISSFRDLAHARSPFHHVCVCHHPSCSGLSFSLCFSTDSVTASCMVCVGFLCQHSVVTPHFFGAFSVTARLPHSPFPPFLSFLSPDLLLYNAHIIVCHSQCSRSSSCLRRQARRSSS